MTKPTRIALSASRDIPFNQLVLSQANVRRVKAGVSIDALAADIVRRGLLQSLTVRPQRDAAGAETGKFEVPAGGRRFRALQQLVKAKRLSRTEPVPCIVRDDAEISAEEDSLAENTHREALHPLDQFRAMQALALQGTDVETIAATFMTTPAVVKQRLRLASVSPRLHDIYAEDGMTLEQLMAFSVSEDHARQEQVWELLQSSSNRQPYMIRHRLTEEAVRASDKRALFVGLDTYVAQGGYVLRDLFEADDGGWLQDVALLDRLVDEKLKSEVERIAGEGWKWVLGAVEFAYDADAGMRILEGEQPALTDEQEAALEALRREAEQLEAEWSERTDIPDEIDARVTVVDEAIAAIVSRPAVAHAAMLHALVLDGFYRYSSAESCVEIAVRGGGLGTHAPGLGDSAPANAIEQRHATWSDRLPDDPEQLWETLAGFSGEDQAALFAHCVSFGINAVWEPANRYNENRVSARTVAGRIAHAHILARESGLDPVAAGWAASVENYLGRVTKARILSAVEEAKGSEAADRLTGLKKPDMAREAETLLAGSGWVAEPLRTPPLEPAPQPRTLLDVAADVAAPEPEDDAPMAIAAE